MKAFRNKSGIKGSIVVLLLLLLTACAQPTGPVTCRSTLEAGEVRGLVRLSDGELVFQELYEYPTWQGQPVVTEEGPRVYSPMHATRTWAVPDSAVQTEYSYEDLVEYIQCDIVQVLTDAGVSARCIPAEEDFRQSRWRLTEDVRRTFSGNYTYDLHAGTMWGGEIYEIREGIGHYSSAYFIARAFSLAINYSGELTGLHIDPGMWLKDPNSRVGELPVFISTYNCGCRDEFGLPIYEFCACFTVAGYDIAVYSMAFTQQEFVDVLLAIINHYGAYSGAYPPQTS